MKKVLALVLSLILMLGGNAVTLAENEQSLPPLNEISSNPNSATFTWRKDVSTQDVEKKEICFTRTGISKLSSTSVSISQTTQTNATAGVIEGYMFVQRWYNNKWESYATFYFSKCSATICESAHVVSVESGYYYRLAVTHIAIFDAGQVSSCDTYTKSIFVN